MYPSMESESAQLFKRAQVVMPGGNTRSTLYYPPYPIYITEGRGSKAIDPDGNEYTDFINCFSASIHGHCHPKIIERVQQQLNKLISVAAPSDAEIELAEILVDRIPSFERVRFCSSGTEAVMHTIRAARAFTGKPRIAKVEGCYHGTYDAAEVSQNSNPGNWGEASAPASTSTSFGTPDGVKDDVVVLNMNDIQGSIAILENHKEHLAGVLLDVLPARMNFIPMKPEYIRAIQAWCVTNGALLIFDEVFSLRGGYRGMQGEYGVTPDLTATGKLVGGGFPIGVFGGRTDVMDVFNVLADGGAKVTHGGTHNAHPVSIAAGIASMKLWDQAAVTHINGLGKRVREGIDAALRDAGIPGTTYGYGSMIGWFYTEDELHTYRDIHTAQHQKGVQGKLFKHWLNNGILAAARGGLILSTVMTEAEIDHLIEQTSEAFKAIQTSKS